MTALPRRTSTRVLAAVVGVIVIAAAVFGWPYLRPLVISTNEPAEMPAESDHDHAAMAGGASDGAAAEPRSAVQLDARRQQLAGVRTAPVERRSLTSTIRTVGMVTYDETRLTDVNLRVEGWVQDLFVDYTGRAVEAGEPLFTLYSPDLFSAQQEYLLAREARAQVAHSNLPEVHSQAERLVETARRRIELWELPDDQLRAVEESGTPVTALTFRAPVTGYVIDKQVVRGQHVSPGQTLYRIADLSRVWVEVDVYEQDVRRIRVGQTARVTIDAYPGEPLSGRVTYLYPYVTEATRTFKVRVELANRGTRLKPGMFANVELASALSDAVVVPADALVDSGSRQLVFVAEGNGYFEPRDVSVGQRAEGLVQVLSGLEPGEQVALAGTFFLDSESQLRAAVEAFAPTAAPMAPSASDNAAQALALTLRSTPDPPQTGENTFEVTVHDAAGLPIADASVSLVLFMPAMPSMNMPAMRSAVTLSSVGGGVYRGTGQVLMAGRWEATVTVVQGDRTLGSRLFPVVTR